VAFCLAAALPLLSGCGTVLNLTAGCWHGKVDQGTCSPEVYGGVHRDLDCAAESLVLHSPLPEVLGGLVQVPVILCIDLPLSAVADTLTLPLTLRASQLKNDGQEQPITISPEAEAKPTDPDGRQNGRGAAGAVMTPSAQPRGPILSTQDETANPSSAAQLAGH
jgi:uncharacterized protein YceK